MSERLPQSFGQPPQRGGLDKPPSSREVAARPPEGVRLTLTYTPLEAGDGESFWIRLEQEKPEEESLTVAEAAEIIDSLFEIEPCDDGMGGGGEEADEGNDPTEEELDAAMAEMLRRTGVCHEDEYWEAVVRVCRSHRQPEYELRSETAEVDTVEPVRTSCRETVEASGAVIELSMPYDGNLQGVPAGVNWSARGSTINLDRPVNGRLVLRYDTYFERVTLRVPAEPDPNGGRATLPGAAVAAFWRDMAATCELDPPERDDDPTEAEREKICNEPGEGGGSISGTGCWKTVTHYDSCSCSNKRVNEWTEVVPADCGRAVGGSNVGKEEDFGDFVWCDGEGDEDLQNPEYYKRRCCKYPEKPLPGCRRSYRKYRGGHEIENGAAHWMDIYGPETVLMPVLPEGGECGDEITEWRVPQKNCCDDVEPLAPSPDNPEHIEPGATYLIAVVGGKDGELTWTARGGLKFRETGTTTYKTASRGVYVVADDHVCPHPVVTVDDGCFPLVMTFEGTESEPPRLPDDMTITSNQHFQVAVSGGVPGYLWQAGGGLELLGWSEGGGQAFFKTPDDPLAWCMGEITVVDVCGRSASMTVYNGDRGSWKNVDQFDPCNVPGMPFLPDDTGSWPLPGNWSLPKNGYRVQYVQDGSGDDYSHSCPTKNLRCPGGMVVDINAFLASRCVSSDNYVTEYDFERSCCKATHRRDSRFKHSTRYGTYAARVLKWVCG